MFRESEVCQLPDYEIKTIEGVQSSTRHLLDSFKSKITALKSCGPEISKLLRFGFDQKAASDLASEFFGSDDISYVAIDGTDSVDEQLDLLVFYAGAFAYYGFMKFEEGDISIGEPTPMISDLSVSAAIPLSEEDAAQVFGQKTESGVEVDSERLPGAVMHLAEYYLARKAVLTDKRTKVILLDRTLAGDVGHLNWSTKDLIDNHLSILEGMDTPSGKVTNFDLQLARMLLPNPKLGVPSPRSQLLKYAAIELLLRGERLSVQQIIGRLGASSARSTKLQEEFGEFESEHRIFKQLFNFELNEPVKNYWNRVIYAADVVAEHVFESKGGHPLRFKKAGKECWVTADDFDFLTLIFIYALVREAWARNLLMIGLIKDTSAAELVKTVVPILAASGLIRLGVELPNFNSDKMLLQTNSVVNSKGTPAPWHTVDIDASFRTMAPEADPKLKKREARVRGSFKNVINPERTFVKCYIQLWSSEENPTIRSHVFSFDRPVYHAYDHWDEITLHHFDNKVDEKIKPVLHFDRESPMTNLAMAILTKMAQEVIPEALGHNFPLFMADKKAKSVLGANRQAYLGAVSLEMSKSDLDQQVLFGSRFRDYRSQIEARRKK